MPAKPRLAIVIITPPGRDAPEAEVLQSVRAANDGRVFAPTAPIIAVGAGRAEAWQRGLAEARAGGAEWIFLLDAGELLHPDALAMLAPALAAYDIVWGGAEITAPDGTLQAPRRAKFSGQSRAELHHMALEWWVGGSHLMRAAAGVISPEDAGDPAWFARYLSRLWRARRCLKTAQPLTRVPALAELSPEDRQFLIEDLVRHPCFIELQQFGEPLKLPYTGRNPALEREQLRGLFSEQPDLMVLKALLPGPGTIVDIGANTGNHTLFFARILKAKTVILIEPNPDAIGFLKAMIAENRLDNVDVSCLGTAIGAATGRAGIATGRRGHLGTARLRADAGGAIEVRPLGEMITQKVDLLKIDVEDMEEDVLKGAEALIRRDRPLLMLEVQDENLLPILDITDGLGYTVRHIFADFGYANYIFMPGAAEERI